MESIFFMGVVFSNLDIVSQNRKGPSKGKRPSSHPFGKGQVLLVFGPFRFSGIGVIKEYGNDLSLKADLFQVF